MFRGCIPSGSNFVMWMLQKCHELLFEATKNRYLLVCLSYSPDFNKASHFSRAIQVFTRNRTMAQWFFFPLFSILLFFFPTKMFFFSCNLKHRKRGDSTFSSLHRKKERKKKYIYTIKWNGLHLNNETLSLLCTIQEKKGITKTHKY